MVEKSYFFMMKEWLQEIKSEKTYDNYKNIEFEDR